MRKLVNILVITLLCASTESSLGVDVAPEITVENDDFEVLLSTSSRAISCFNKPSQFYVILKNKTNESKRLFEYWNSWGYQNISFLFHVSGETRLVTRKHLDFTRNFPSTYEIPSGEVIVFPIIFDQWWHELPNIAEGESKVNIQIVYECKPSVESEESKVWTGTVSSKVYEVVFWRAHSDTLKFKADSGESAAGKE